MYKVYIYKSLTKIEQKIFLTAATMNILLEYSYS